jgi:hypothetical protein
LKTSRPRRVAIVVATVIVVFAVGGFLFHSLSTAKRSPQPLTFTSVWLGEWSGTIAQPDSAVHSWTFSMRLREARGKIVGSYVESSLGCSGTLSTTFADSSRLELNEAVTSQPPAGTPWFCGGGPIQIQRNGTDSATYRWEGGVAHGVIRR